MDAVIFDFDGVLVDSERYWDDMDREFFRTLVPSWTLEDGDRMSGLGTEEGYALLARDYGVTLPFPEYVRRLEAAVETVVYGEKIRLLPGIPELLALLHDRRLPIGIASSAHRSWVDTALVRLGLNGVAAAKAAGMTCIAIRTDMNPRQDLSQADRVITDFAEIDAMLE